VGATKDVSTSDIKLVIGASSAGTVFEWYDFFIYATLGELYRQGVLSIRQ
jgi:hypothetical protein